jgi:hypothetical protein
MKQVDQDGGGETAMHSIDMAWPASRASMPGELLARGLGVPA